MTQPLAMTHTESHPFQAQFDAAAPHLPGHDDAQITALRRSAMDYGLAQGFPTKRLEAWRYMDVSHLQSPPPLSLQPRPTSMAWFDALALPDMACSRLVFSNGWFVPSLSDSEVLEGEITVSPISVLLPPETGHVFDGLTFDHQAYHAPFDAFNLALMTDGWVINVPDGVTLEKPIHIITYHDAPISSHLRQIVRLGTNASATVIHQHVGANDVGYWLNVAGDYHLGEQASLRTVRLQQEGDHATHTQSIAVYQDAHSHFAHHFASLGSRKARQEIRVSYSGDHASTSIEGVYAGHGTQLFDHYFPIEHRRHDCRSHQNIRGVMTGRASGTYYGRAVVPEGTHSNDVAQLHKGLLLSDHATINARPELEIYTDQITASHGATVGSLDEDALYYLMGRGIPGEEALQLLIAGFMDEVLSSLEPEAVREWLIAAVQEDLMRHAV